MASLYTLSFSPVIIADDANIDVAARRIVWGKLLNSGQTCIAPDYILCSPGKRERLVEKMKKTLVEFYGSEVCLSIDLWSIITHFFAGPSSV